jgi:hypothetical protein
MAYGVGRLVTVTVIPRRSALRCTRATGFRPGHQPVADTVAASCEHAREVSAPSLAPPDESRG